MYSAVPQHEEEEPSGNPQEISCCLKCHVLLGCHSCEEWQMKEAPQQFDVLALVASVLLMILALIIDMIWHTEREPHPTPQSGNYRLGTMRLQDLLLLYTCLMVMWMIAQSVPYACNWCRHGRTLLRSWGADLTAFLVWNLTFWCLLGLGQLGSRWIALIPRPDQHWDNLAYVYIGGAYLSIISFSFVILVSGVVVLHEYWTAAGNQARKLLHDGQLEIQRRSVACGAVTVEVVRSLEVAEASQEEEEKKNP